MSLAASAQRVADRYMIRLAAREACAGHPMRLARRGVTPEVLAAFGEAFYVSQHRGKVAFAGLVSKLKQIGNLFSAAPKVWEKFKQLVGIKSLADIPSALKDMASKGKAALQKVLTKMFDTWPLKIYTLEKGKLLTFNDLLLKLIGLSPKLKHLVESGMKKVGDFGEMLRQKAPTLTGVVLVAIYIFIWINVMEFEWDFKALADALTGAMTFHDFLSSLPGSAFGALLNIFKLGTFSLLPYTVVARILYLVGHRYLVWTGRWFALDWKTLHEDFGIEPHAVPGLA